MAVDPAILEYLQREGYMPAPASVPEGGDRITLESPSAAPTNPDQVDIAGLIAAQNADEQTRRNQAIGRAGEMAAAVVGGRSPQLEAFDPKDQAVKDFVLRDQLKRRATEGRLAKEKAAAAAEMAKKKFELEVKKAGGLEEYRKAQIADLTAKPSREAEKRALEEKRQEAIDLYRKSQLDISRSRLGMEGQRIALEKSRSGVGGEPDENSPVALKARAIIEGRQPPDLKGLYKMALPVSAELERQGFDLSEANLQWEGQKRLVSSLNGPQQTRLGQATRMVKESLGKVDELYKNWQREGIASRFPTLNEKDIEIAIAGGGKRGAAAQALQTLINDLVLEQATVLMGGNAPTEQAMVHARENIQAQWGSAAFGEALKLMRFNTNARLKAMQETRTNLGGGTQKPNRYQKGDSTTEGEPLADPSGATVVERRVTKTGRVLERMSDGTVREAP